MTPNIKLRTNVVLVKGVKNERLHLLNRVKYWELLSRRTKYPLKFYFSLGELSEEQKAQVSQYLAHDDREGFWNSTVDFKPFPSRTDIVPWYENAPEIIGEGIPEPEDEPGQDAESVATEEVTEDLDLQRLVVEEDPEKCLYVDAPPGTGKTHSLIERLEWLVTNQHVKNPSQECLVLSFSRAVVRELKSRLQKKTQDGAPDDLAYVSIRTIDSYGTRMMTMGDDGQIIPASGYLARISQFTQLLRNGGLPDAAVRELSAVRFLVVDEVQDLVGSRADMISELVKLVINNGGSFFCLGDPCQSINDYQLKEAKETSDTTSFNFLDRIKEIGEGRFVKHTLSKRFRYNNEDMNDFVVRCRHAMGEDGRSPDETVLRNEIGTFPTIPISDISNIYDVRDGKKYAILCRNNLQLYQVAAWCRQSDVPCQVRTRSDGQMWPAWMARIFFGFRGVTMSVDLLEIRWAKLIGEKENFDRAREMLRECGLMQGDIINIEDLCAHIENHTPPLKEMKGIEIATIHKSKGLEYDRVFRVESVGGYRADHEKRAEECRVLYVAATRAKDRFYSLSADEKVFFYGKSLRYDSRFSASGLSGFQDKSTGEFKIILTGSEYFDHFHQSMAHGDEIKNSQEAFWYLSNAREPTISVKGGNWCDSIGKKLCPVKGLFGSSNADILDVPVQSFGTIAVPRSAGDGFKERLLITANLFGTGVL